MDQSSPYSKWEQRVRDTDARRAEEDRALEASIEKDKIENREQRQRELAKTRGELLAVKQEVEKKENTATEELKVKHEEELAALLTKHRTELEARKAESEKAVSEATKIKRLEEKTIWNEFRVKDEAIDARSVRAKADLEKQREDEDSRVMNEVFKVLKAQSGVTIEITTAAKPSASQATVPNPNPQTPPSKRASASHSKVSNSNPKTPPSRLPVATPTKSAGISN